MTALRAPSNKNYIIFQLFFSCFLLSVIFASYISSWSPLFFGLPFGSFLRDVFLLTIFATSCGHLPVLRIEKKILVVIFLYLSLLILSCAAFLVSESIPVQFIIGMHVYFVYPALFIFLLLIFNKDEFFRSKFLNFLKWFLAWMFLFCAVFAILDVYMNGELTKLFGYRRDYGGDNFSLIVWYYDQLRANGGFADALVFGYLMSLACIFYMFLIRVEGARFLYILGLVFCVGACMLSLTRGAMLITFLSLFCFFLTLRIQLVASLILLVLPMIILMTFLNMNTLIGRFTDSDQGSNRSTMKRLEMAENSVDYLLKKPMGAGIGTQAVGNIFTKKDQRINSDNFIFHVLLELGFFLGVLFFVMFYFMMSFFLKRKVSFETTISMMAFVLICSIFSSSLNSATLSIFFWVLLFFFSFYYPNKLKVS